MLRLRRDGALGSERGWVMVPYKCSECGRRDVMLHFDGGPKAYCDICFREKCKQEPMEDELAKLKAENAKMREELAECYAETVVNEGYLIVTGDRKGWYDSMAKGSVTYAGDKLVELDTWERHPDGHGRRWYYRPIQKGAEDV